jgi:ribosomal protein L11 methyltransferase
MPESSWLEVSLIVEPELVEPVSEILSRFAPGGVAVESTDVTPDENNQYGRFVGPLRVVAYIPLSDDVESIRYKIEESLWYLGRIRPLPDPQFRYVEETDWSEAWKEHYRPIPIGNRLIIVPAWMENPVGERIPISMDPGMAFGTGTHPTTQLCLEYVEELISSKKVSGMHSVKRSGEHSNGEVNLYPHDENDATQYFGESQSVIDVIDIGCGSGILSVAAIKLGARFALGVDVDPLAVKVSRENAVINNVSDNIEFGVGSLENILNSEFSISTAPIVFANILAPVIIKLLDNGLGETLTSHGSLILSGIIDVQENEIVKAIRRNNLKVISKRQIDDWVALCVEKD